MGKLDINKKAKEDSLLATAYKLFTTNGVSKTSVSDIAKSAGVAKGTFYLYFKDKYDLHEKLVIHKSEQLFRHALEESGYQSRSDAAGKILAIIDDILSGMKKSGTAIQVIPDREKAIAWALDKARPGDVILLAGKGHEDYQVVGKEKRHMDEREIVASLLAARRRN